MEELIDRGAIRANVGGEQVTGAGCSAPPGTTVPVRDLIMVHAGGP
jgi:hypothetical protein